MTVRFETYQEEKKVEEVRDGHHTGRRNGPVLMQLNNVIWGTTYARKIVPFIDDVFVIKKSF